MRVRLLLALSVCGCTGLAGTRPAGWGPSRYLLGAEEGMTIIAQPEEEGAAAGEVLEEKLLVFGVRLGVFAPSGSKEEFAEYDVGPLGGAFLRGLQLAEKSLAWEAGVELTGLDTPELYGSTNLLRLRGSILYGKWYSESSTKFYLLGGGALLVEMEADTSGKVGSLDLGAGICLGKLDARVGFSVLIGSQNVKNVATAAVGYLF